MEFWVDSFVIGDLVLLMIRRYILRVRRVARSELGEATDSIRSSFSIRNRE